MSLSMPIFIASPVSWENKSSEKFLTLKAESKPRVRGCVSPMPVID